MEDPIDSDEHFPDGPTATVIRSLVGKGWTQKRIARHLKIPEARLSRWAHGMGTRLCDDALRIHALNEDVLANGRWRPGRRPMEHVKAG